jgi:small subunit ribosomal protein S24e
VELEIVEERANPLLKRTEYRFRIQHVQEPTPKRAEVRQALAKAAKLPVERLVIEEMHARFGVARSEGKAFYYQSAEALAAVAREHILVRNGLKEKAEKAPPPAEAPPPAAAKPVEKAPEKPAEKAPEKPPSKAAAKPAEPAKPKE